MCSLDRRFATVEVRCGAKQYYYLGQEEANENCQANIKDTHLNSSYSGEGLLGGIAKNIQSIA